MRHVVCLVLVVLVGMAAPTAAVAQQWSAAEQEVITQLKQCWDTWMDSIRAGKPDAWIQSCTEPGYSYWNVDGAPAGADVLRRNWKVIASQDVGWVDIRPLVVKIIGDIAMVQFYSYWNVATPSGPTTAEWKRTEIFRRVNGKWLLTMGHSTPVSAKDAEPYKR